MNYPRLMATLLLIALALTIPAYTQDTAKKDAPRKGPSQLVLEQWNDVARFPEDKYDYKPTPAQRTFAEQLLHAAGTTYYFTNLANGQKPPAEEDPKRDNFKSKAEIVAFVKKCFGDGAAAIKARGDKGMYDWVVDPGSKQEMQVADLAYGFIEHSGEHYGQLAVYYRVAGMVPPESRPQKK